MDSLVLAGGFLAAAVRVATPLLFAATGETITERSGVINLGIEGINAGRRPGRRNRGNNLGTVGVVLAMAALAGMLAAGLFALLAIGARADQVITGTAVTLAMVGLTGTIYRQAYGAQGVGPRHTNSYTLRTYRFLVCTGFRCSGPLAFFSQPVPHLPRICCAAVGLVGAFPYPRGARVVAPPVRRRPWPGPTGVRDHADPLQPLL